MPETAKAHSAFSWKAVFAIDFTKQFCCIDKSGA